MAIGTGANLPHYRSAGDTGAAAGIPGEGAVNTSDLATTAPPLTLTGLDQSPEMMRRARTRASGLGIDLTLHTGDATALPFGDDSFDSYVCTYAMCSIPDVRLALTEALRVLRPGGRLLLADHVAATNWILRGAQHLLNLFSVPLQGESYTRRPMNQLTELSTSPGTDLTIVGTDRLHHGAIERIHATTGN